MARLKDGATDTSKHQPGRRHSETMPSETRRRPQESFAEQGSDWHTHAGGRRQTKRTGRVRSQRSGADEGARSIGNGSAHLIGRLSVIPAEQGRNHDRTDRDRQEPQHESLDDAQHCQGVAEQSVQVPEASHCTQVVPSSTFSVFAASSVVTVALFTSPPFSRK